jgi:hypothetical protein
VDNPLADNDEGNAIISTHRDLSSTSFSAFVPPPGQSDTDMGEERAAKAEEPSVWVHASDEEISRGITALSRALNKAALRLGTMAGSEELFDLREPEMEPGPAPVAVQGPTTIYATLADMDGSSTTDAAAPENVVVQASILYAQLDHFNRAPLRATVFHGVYLSKGQQGGTVSWVVETGQALAGGWKRLGFRAVMFALFVRAAKSRSLQGNLFALSGSAIAEESVIKLTDELLTLILESGSEVCAPLSSPLLWPRQLSSRCCCLFCLLGMRPGDRPGEGHC